MEGQPYIAMPGNRINQPDPPIPNVVSPSGQVSGHGSPEGVVPGNVGQLYVDVDTDNLWQKAVGTQENGWRLRGVFLAQGGGSGGGLTTGAFGGNAPAVAPSGGTGTAVDTDTGKVWFFYASAWHFSGLTLS